jgi:hypothetical protein
MLYRPAHDGRGGLVLGLPDPPPVPGVGRPLPALVPAPAARPVLPWLGGAAGGGAGAALAVAQVLPALGADGPPGDQQPLIAGAGGGGSWRRRRHWFSSSTAHHTSPADRSSPNSRFRWARVTRSPHRAVRYTTGGASRSRFRGTSP